MNIIEISEEDKDIVRKYFNKSKEDINRDVEIVKEWLKKQPHLPPISDDDFIERILVRTKFRIEKSKNCIDSYFTAKTMWPELYEGIHEIVPSKGCALFFPIDKLTDNAETVIILSIKSPPDQFHLFEMSRIVVAHLELFLNCNYTLGVHIIWDLAKAEVGHMKQLTDISLMKKLFTVLLNVYSSRVKGLYIFKPPSWVSVILNLFNHILPKQIVERVSVHNDSDTLLELIPKHCLPTEYGGTNKSVQEIIRRNDEVFLSNQKFFLELQERKSNEKLRIGNSHLKIDMFGVDGTFKKLNID